MWYCCTWRVLLAASDRLIGFVTYEDTPSLFPSQSTTFGYISVIWSGGVKFAADFEIQN